jgi:hypothetical protein
MSIIDSAMKLTELTKQGVNYRGLCPFHDESTPSFVVRPQNNDFICFGCGTPITTGGSMTNNDELERELSTMNSRDIFELWVADELGHTVGYIKGQRAVTTDRYYNEYIEIPYRAWKAAMSVRSKQEG